MRPRACIAPGPSPAVERLPASHARSQPQAGFAARRVLARHDTQPGTELTPELELVEDDHRGGEYGGAQLADADHARCAPGRVTAAHVLDDLAVTPLHAVVQAAPVVERLLQRDAG